MTGVVLLDYGSGNPLIPGKRLMSGVVVLDYGSGNPLTPGNS
jgi:hypothetical protein